MGKEIYERKNSKEIYDRKDIKEIYNWKDGFYESVVERKKNLEELIQNKMKQLQQAPEGSLRINKRAGFNQYYWRTDPKNPNGVYLPKSKESTARRLAQKDYDNKLVSTAKKELSVVSKYIDILEHNSLEAVYEGLDQSRKELINPVVMSDDVYIGSWLKDEYEPLPIEDSVSELYTNLGVRVRSKSELIIANILEQYGIPYRYEYPLMLKGCEVHPDFICLNVRKRKEYIWEHFGMMDNIAYANNNVRKINSYAQSGYISGKNMICTFETSQNVLNSNTVISMITEFLI